MQMTTEEGKVRLILDGELTVAGAAQFREMLIQAMASSDRVELDMGEVTALDLSCLQLICSAHRTAQVSGKELTLGKGQSEILKKARMDAGYIRHQGCRYNPTETCLWVGGVE
jgi:ABC-type transporter Mla MlaB component